MMFVVFVTLLKNKPDRMIRVVHFIKDDKFTDGVFNTFVHDKRLENVAVYYCRKRRCQLKWVKDIQPTFLRDMESLIRFLEQGDYDVLYFHSLPVYLWKYIKYIPEGKIVIWWLYGYEVYTSYYGQCPIININLYKKKTKRLRDYSSFNLQSFIRTFLLFLRDDFFPRLVTKAGVNKYAMLKRIDYMQPIFSNEINMISRAYPYFKAKEFYNNNSLYFDIPEIRLVKKNGTILFGNSASYENNHMDIWNTIAKYIKDNNLLIPLNYGLPEYRKYLMEHIKYDKAVFLDKFIPKEEYFNLLDSCSYFVIGVMRQQASENIYYCLSHGIKVFFYKDSIPYNYYKEKGYYVYTIEDIDNMSFSSPLNTEQILHNQKMLKKEKDYCDGIYQDVISSLFNTCSTH